jgi:hypothetical protein
MIPRDAEPIGHIPPLPRIDLNPRRPADPNVRPEIKHTTENERIWKLLVQAAESCNIGAGA